MRRDSASPHDVSQSVDSNLAKAVSTVANLLEKKGGDVVTIRPQETIAHAVATLREKRIGAIVVTDAEGALQGILSERDVVSKLAEVGAEVLSLSVADLMTREVTTCDPDERIIAILQKMTDGRFRHVPVIRDGRLIGLVSIGDLVNYRLRELEYEALKMKQMIVG
ncbi:inosine-5-monophosphate dehydrogenase [Paracoccus halophilus]|nr:inosine-5-monophosphate dehydrogenase [Paracoccus halophilus]